MQTELTRSAKTRAVRAIGRVHEAQYEKGGIRDLEAAIADRKAAAAKHVYALAVYATETTKTRAAAAELFLAMCAHAEDTYKKQHGVENLAEALPTWRTFKSNILTGMRDYGLDPREHRTEGAFRVAKAKVKAAEPTTPPAGDWMAPPNVVELPKPGAVVPSEKVDDLLTTTIQQDSLRWLVSQIVFELETLKRSRVKEAEAILRETMDKLAPLVDQRKAA